MYSLSIHVKQEAYRVDLISPTSYQKKMHEKLQEINKVNTNKVMTTPPHPTALDPEYIVESQCFHIAG